MNAAEDHVGHIARYISDLRFNLQADCVALINERGQILARAGSLPDTEIETTLMPELMTVFFAAGRIATHTGSPTIDDLMVFRNPRYHLHLSSVAPNYALLVVTPELSAARLAPLAEGLQRSLERITPQLAGLERALRPPDESTQPIRVKAGLEDTDPHLEDVLHEAKTKPIDRGHAEKFWQATTEHLLVNPPKGAALTYEQALQLGLVPIKDK